MTITIVDLVFAFMGLAAFRVWRAPSAALIVFLGGWIVLPNGHYPDGASLAEFPYWITGLALPSDMLLTKAWIAPVVALLGALAFDRETLRRLRPGWIDGPILAWCLWPLLQSLLTLDPRPAPWLASLYLAGCWGTPWLLGRLYFADAPGQRLLVQGLALSALACLPFSLIEGLLEPKTYGLLYGDHPFRFDGDARYLGYRPIGLFEHGNQFGLWISLCALGALWLAASAAPGRARRGWHVVAAIVSAQALAAQSVGAILLLALGSAFLSASRWLRPRVVIWACASLLVLGGAAYVSGAIPLARLAKETSLGHHVVDSFRALGRGSFTWRIAQDQKLLPQAMAKPLQGSGQWDWWRSSGTRPWGLTMLILGQFGVAGLCLSLGALLWPALHVAWPAPRASGWQPRAVPLLLASLIVLTVLDALMNSFIFFPALVAAGALAHGPAQPLDAGLPSPP